MTELKRLYVSDIFRIFTNYEPSRSKIWEIVRSYCSADIATFLFLIQNVRVEMKRIDLALTSQQQRILFARNLDEIAEITKKDAATIVLPLCLEPVVRFTRVHTNYESFSCLVEWRQYETVNTNDITSHVEITTPSSYIVPSDNNRNCNSTDSRHTGNEPTSYIENFHHPVDETIDKILEYVRTGKTISIHENCFTSLLMHNLGTRKYANFANNVQYLLLPEHLHTNRNDVVEQTALLESQRNVMTRFIQFYAELQNGSTKQQHDARSLRGLCLPRPKRIETFPEFRDFIGGNSNSNDSSSAPRHIFQPLLQGYHMVVSANGGETRCYNRYGELLLGVGYKLHLPFNCTFECVMLPLTSDGVARSWRYWLSPSAVRNRYILYICDIFRLNDSVFLDEPFHIRITHVESLKSFLESAEQNLLTELLSLQKQIRKVDGDEHELNRLILRKNQITKKLHSCRFARQVIRPIPSELSDWRQILYHYSHNVDVYDPVVGVVVRDSYKCELQQPHVFKFNILYLYNLLENRVQQYGVKNWGRSLSATDVQALQTQEIKIQEQFINFEMSDYMTIAMVYADCRQYLYLCTYDREFHQFVHFAKLSRLPYDSQTKINYKPERLYIVNNQAPRRLTLGIAYIRLYYDINYQIMGYEFKMTDSRYKLPLTLPKKLLTHAIADTSLSD